MRRDIEAGGERLLLSETAEAATLWFVEQPLTPFVSGSAPAMAGAVAVVGVC